LAPSEKNIALTGFMAAGKSVVGQRLAQRMRRRFVDLDQSIEEREGMEVRAIFERKGEAYFRKAEKEVLREVLRQEGLVIATGGGTVVDEENLRLLKRKSLLICLTAPPETLFQRAGSGPRRPLLQGDSQEERLKELLRQRGRAYAQAHLSIETGALSVDEVVEEILKRLDAYG